MVYDRGGFELSFSQVNAWLPLWSRAFFFVRVVVTWHNWRYE